jgi:hypothetical protein
MRLGRVSETTQPVEKAGRRSNQGATPVWVLRFEQDGVLIPLALGSRMVSKAATAEFFNTKDPGC